MILNCLFGGGYGCRRLGGDDEEGRMRGVNDVGFNWGREVV